MVDILLWAITILVFLGPPIFILLRSEAIYNFIYKFWSKIVDEETKTMIVENKSKFIVFIKILGGFYLFSVLMRFAVTFLA